MTKDEIEKLAQDMGKRLYMLRTYHNLQQGEFAEKIGTYQRMVSEWESGKRLMSTKYIFEISRVFNISISHFNPKEESCISQIPLALAVSKN